jgi:transposase
MDNVPFHHSGRVLETARMMKANVLFNAEYSPFLNPIEQLFRVLKNKLKVEDVRTR